jgi:SAM-dependent methyltransferase
MPPTRSRYDGHADWYDRWNKPNAERNATEVRHLLGPGDGLCPDLGCGGGHYFEVLAATGRPVVGLDRSADQLRIARGRYRQIVQGDAAALNQPYPVRAAGRSDIAARCSRPAREGWEARSAG